MKEIKFYNKLKKFKELNKIIKIKFQLFKSFNKLYNIIMHIRGFAPRMAEFLKLISQIIPFNNRIR